MKPIISLSPHVHGGDSVQKNMYGVCIALVPALLASLWFFGLGAAIVLATSVASCVFFEWAITKFLLKRPACTVCDGSAILTGLLLGFNLPSNLPLWLIIVGALVAIGIGKMTFGGLGQNPFNPALVGRVFLLISFPVQMTSWPVSGQLTAYMLTRMPRRQPRRSSSCRMPSQAATRTSSTNCPMQHRCSSVRREVP